MWLCSLLLLLFALSVTAQRLPVSGPLKPGPGDTPDALKVSEDAGRQPNVTTSVTFIRTYDNEPEQWTWRVNITEVAIPNRLSDLGKLEADFSEGLHIANTQWELGWPIGGNDDSLQALLRERNMNLSFTSLVLGDVPSDVRDRYKDEDGGECVPVLGDVCARNLHETASKGGKVRFSELEGCKDLSSQYNGVSYDIGPGEQNTNSSDANGAELQRGGTLFFQTSEAYKADNATLFNQARSALRVLVMGAEYGSNPRGEMSGPTVLCRILDKAKGDGSSGEDNSPASGACEGHVPILALCAGMVLSTLFVV